MLVKKESDNKIIDNGELQEIISLLKRLNPEQKKIAVAAIRGAVLIADSDKEGVEDAI